MIKYYGGSFGLEVILRLHGSAAFKSITPAALSTIIYVILFHTTDLTYNAILGHPYPIGALIAAFSFLLTFKMSFSYNRYWEACGAVYQMHSKWLDVGTEMASFHLQSNKFKNKPPAFGHHPELTSIERERERYNEPTPEQIEQRVEELRHVEDVVSLRSKIKRWSDKAKKNSKKKVKDSKPQEEMRQEESQPQTASDSIAPEERKVKFSNEVKDAPVISSSNENDSTHHDRDTIQIVTSKKQVDEEAKQVSLFLQETAHLLSLLSAVAMSTLRNDLEGAESPLATFVPGASWPCEDPDALNADVRKDWTRSKQRFWTVFQYLFGRTRTGTNRTLYNAARPFRVVGGVSDAEIQMLQAARGPLAKVALCSMWLQEFISREYMAGSTGGVAPPIISRLFQFVSDGMLGYNQARKIAYIPFPFPHQQVSVVLFVVERLDVGLTSTPFQITSLFIFVVVALIPILMLTFVENEYLGVALNIVTVMCFTGLHEVCFRLEVNEVELLFY